MLNFSIDYEKKLENEKLFLEMFYTLMSTASFMVAANSIMTMLMGSTDAESILVYSVIGVAVSMTAFVLMMYMMFPRDKMQYLPGDGDFKFRMRVYMMVGMGTGTAIALYFVGIIPTSLVVGVALAPLIYPGMLARKIEEKIKELNEWYPSFIRHFGEIYSTVGSMGTALQAVLRSDFGPIQKHIVAFKNRTKNRIDQKLCFELFSRDTTSEIIANGNLVMANALDKGGNMHEAGNKVSDITVKINELRAKRAQTSKTFETVLLVLHVLSLAVFALMNKLTTIFDELISTIDISNSTFSLTPIDPELMAIMLPVMILITSIINAMALKVAQGGLYKTVFYHIALFAVLGSVVTFVMDGLLADFLETSILDLGVDDVL